MDLQKLTNLLEQFVLEVPVLISEDLKGIPKPNEKLIDCSTHCHFCSLGGEGHILDQFGETVHHHEYVFIPRFSAREGA